ncbi:diaminopimelate decarboxylase [uncultured Campylobacter sp.]|uniref:diaminopimelate decarboxylase n=1 Tax=uncultured Campylobacter sp. TaxID=218934 RepID=UPI00263402DE|nr:diaminopimelate decarboxylase [uncultured Campylobacter sp.]
MDYSSLARKYGTPLYVYDFNEIQKNFIALKEAFAARKSLVCFAIKASSNLSILKFLSDLGSGFDCVSIGELRRALYIGAKSYKIIFSGVGKQDSELEFALKSDILLINLESEAEMLRLEQIAQKLNKPARISIRVNPNVDAKTHPYISTGLSENKFGVSIETARKMYIYAKKSKFLNPVGIHFHIGSQLTDISPICDAAKIVSDLLRELRALEIDIKFFDVGGGIGIRYEDEKQIVLYDYAQGILKSLSGLDVTIVCEPGRFIAGAAGVFLTRVLYEKQNCGKRFVIVDGAMNDLIRPSLYGAHHKIELVSERNSACESCASQSDTENSTAQNSTYSKAFGIEAKSASEDFAPQNSSDLSSAADNSAPQSSAESLSPCDVVGPICESGDFLAKGVSLPSLQSGDLLAIKSAGAYGFSMSSNYNTRPRAAEVAVYDGQDRLIRKRESFDELIALEKDLV